MRPREKCTLEDQLGLVLSPKSKIEDGSDLGACNTQVTSVADFWFPYSVELQLVPRLLAVARRLGILKMHVQRNGRDAQSTAHVQQPVTLSLPT